MTPPMTGEEKHSAEVILKHTEGKDHASIVARALLRLSSDECCRAQALTQCRHGNLHSESTGKAVR